MTASLTDEAGQPPFRAAPCLWFSVRSPVVFASATLDP